MARTAKADEEFWSIVAALRADGIRADAPVVNEQRELRAARIGAVTGGLVVAALTAGLVAAGLPWWALVAFLLYGAPAGVLAWTTITPKVAERLPAPAEPSPEVQKLPREASRSTGEAIGQAS